MNESTDSTTTSGARGRASNLKQRLKQDGRQKIESGKRAAADQIAEIADAIDLAGSQLDQSQPTLASYASKLADGVSGVATRLREDSIEDLYREVRQLAVRHPGMFLLGSAALGVALARFMKASGEEAGEKDWADEDLGESAQSGIIRAEVQAEVQAWDEATADDGLDDDLGYEPLHRQGGAPDSPDPYGTARRGV